MRFFSALSLLTIFLLFGAVSPALAQQQACGGRIQFNADCGNNNRPWAISCCPSGYRVQGVAYTDIKKSDNADAVSAVCRNVTRGNDFIATDDFQRNAVQMVCANDEMLAGIYYKDVWGSQGNSDTMDGVTAICQKPGSDELRTVHNRDLDSNRDGGEQTVLLPRRVLGIASKDRDKGTSDEADCVAIITD